MSIIFNITSWLTGRKKEDTPTVAATDVPLEVIKPIRILEKQATELTIELLPKVGKTRLSSFIEKETVDTLLSGTHLTTAGVLDFSVAEARFLKLPQQWLVLVEKFLFQFVEGLNQLGGVSLKGGKARKPVITVTPETRKMIAAIGLEELVTKGVVENIQTDLLTKNNTKLPVGISASALKDESGSITGMVINARDLTELKNYARERLAELTPALKKVAQGNFVVQLPIPPQEDEFTEHITTLTVMIDDLQKASEMKVKLVDELRREKESLDEKVEERTKELSEEQRKLFSVTEHMEDATILVDDHGQVLFVNKAMKELLHLESYTDVNALQHLFSLFDSEDIRQQVIDCVTNGTSIHLPEANVEQKVYEILIQHLGEGVDGKEESITHGLIFVRDITDEKLLERSKSELVAVASHQLRTPLTAMRGNIEMLMNKSFGELTPDQEEMLEDIDVSTLRLITMVNDMLDISKIERGELELEVEEVNLEETIDSILNDLKGYAERHGVTITHLTPKYEPIVSVDKSRIRQVFQNLIDNAIKYSKEPKGDLTISYAKTDSHIELSFKDNGIGIPETEQSKMFERFYRASNTSKLTSSGTGLGLFVVKSIIKLLGGNIWFESVENNGTTFYVTLPIKTS